MRDTVFGGNTQSMPLIFAGQQKTLARLFCIKKSLSGQVITSFPYPVPEADLLPLYPSLCFYPDHYLYD
jgi:hypothetical protein